MTNDVVVVKMCSGRWSESELIRGVYGEGEGLTRHRVAVAAAASPTVESSTVVAGCLSLSWAGCNCKMVTINAQYRKIGKLRTEFTV